MELNRHSNRLAKEKSPYLLQHAHNPVDWYPWGDEAFERARAEDKPVFLSIGYATCHWCHVMERESFESEEIAAILNEGFVSIKVDREERPDIDQVYMAAVQAMGETGGWPLTVFLTPERKPFFGGTYFPPVGLAARLRNVALAWEKNRADLLADAGALSKALAAQPVIRGEPTTDVLDVAVTRFKEVFDPVWGGFGAAPKFPRPAVPEFLMRRYARTGDPATLNMVEVTLRQMAQGGIYDQLGGGFHRYSLDAQWQAPHFEKMLYDNALLARVYVMAWQLTGDSLYERIARETIGYVLRDLTAPEGAFCCGEDADSEGVEGKFYRWTPQEIETILADAGVRIDSEEGRRKLLDARSRRVRPDCDDKVLAGWNALMIGALARAGAAFDEPSYVEAAERAARFVMTRMRRSNGRLLRRYRAGVADIPAFLEDYASLTDALVDLYQATFKVGYVETAVGLAEDMIRLFGDAAGGFWFGGDDGERLIARMKDVYDGAMPSGNSIALHALVRIGALASREDFTGVAEAAFRAFAGEINRYPQGYPHLISAYDMFRGPIREIVIAGDAPGMLRAARSAFLADAVIVSVPARGLDERTRRAIPMVGDRPAVAGRPTAYICENHACQRPVTSEEEFGKLIRQRR